MFLIDFQFIYRKYGPYFDVGSINNLLSAKLWRDCRVIGMNPGLKNREKIYQMRHSWSRKNSAKYHPRSLIKITLSMMSSPVTDRRRSDDARHATILI